MLLVMTNWKAAVVLVGSWTCWKPVGRLAVLTMMSWGETGPEGAWGGVWGVAYNPSKAIVSVSRDGCVSDQTIGPLGALLFQGNPKVLPVLFGLLWRRHWSHVQHSSILTISSWPFIFFIPGKLLFNTQNNNIFNISSRLFPPLIS